MLSAVELFRKLEKAGTNYANVLATVDKESLNNFRNFCVEKCPDTFAMCVDNDSFLNFVGMLDKKQIKPKEKESAKKSEEKPIRKSICYLSNVAIYQKNLNCSFKRIQAQIVSNKTCHVLKLDDFSTYKVNAIVKTVKDRKVNTNKCTMYLIKHQGIVAVGNIVTNTFVSSYDRNLQIGKSVQFDDYLGTKDIYLIALHFLIENMGERVFLEHYKACSLISTEKQKNFVYLTEIKGTKFYVDTKGITRCFMHDAVQTLSKNLHKFVSCFYEDEEIGKEALNALAFYFPYVVDLQPVFGYQKDYIYFVERN